ncbi:MAG: hypothetical protein L0H84_21365, partial [Pseudonocardia sp.]|nr:hypothetical protein [Pseudonocardia sp.]
MTGMFLALMLIAALLLVNWRLVLVLLFAGLLALIVMGLGVIQPPDVNAVGLPAAVELGSAV